MDDEKQDSRPKDGPSGKGDQTPVRVSTDPSEICRVSVRIPPFWPEEPEIWFAQIEGQFSLSNITSDTTKFNYVISNLDQQFCKEVKDIIISPPATNKYEKLKSELTTRLTATKEKKLQQLLMHEELGDRKPSQFLRHLSDLGGPTLPEDILLSIWKSRLPSNIQTVLAAQPTASREILADLADRVHDIAPQVPQVASTSMAVPGSALDALSKEIAELRRQMQDLSAGMGRSRPQTRSKSRQQRKRSKTGTRSASNCRKFPVCWYHAKFGKNSTRCDKPCDFPSENLPGSQ